MFFHYKLGLFVFIALIIKCCDAKVTTNKSEMIFKDSNNKEMKFSINDIVYVDFNTNNTIKQNILMKHKINYIRQNQMCSCVEMACKCCVGIQLPFISNDNVGCMNMSYNVENLSAGIDLNFNEYSLYNYQLSARNPPPICAPIPQIPGLEFCFRFYNISYEGGFNIRFCVAVLVKFIGQSFPELRITCAKFGPEGVQLMWPDSTRIIGEIKHPNNQQLKRHSLLGEIK